MELLISWHLAYLIPIYLIIWAFVARIPHRRLRSDLTGLDTDTDFLVILTILLWPVAIVMMVVIIPFIRLLWFIVTS